MTMQRISFALTEVNVPLTKNKILQNDYSKAKELKGDKTVI